YHAPSYGWVWYPGEIHVRYYWRPALVTFFGWGANIGWGALAPPGSYSDLVSRTKLWVGVVSRRDSCSLLLASCPGDVFWLGSEYRLGVAGASRDLSALVRAGPHS